MAIWNDTFLATPPNEDNPGRGAEAIRNLKGAIEERLTLDHYWGETDELIKLGGYHKEGSAVAKVLDADQTARNTAGSRIERTSLGTLEADMNLMTAGGGSWRAIAGVDQSAEGSYYDNRRKRVKIHFTDSDLLAQFVELFNPDRYTHIAWDQTIGGDKIFSRAVQAPPDDDSDAVASVPADFNPLDALYATEYLIPAEIFWKWMHDAKYHNLFDRTDVDNDSLLSAAAGIHGETYIEKDISADIIKAEKVYGATYS